MARTDQLFRQTHNDLLNLLTELDPPALLPSELGLAERFRVSRTVIRSIIAHLAENGILRIEGREKWLLRRPIPADQLPLRDDYLPLETLERRFLDWLLRFDVAAGTALNVTQLSRQFSVPPHLLQEFLASLVPSGLIERRERGGWILLGFTADYAIELSQLRLVLELNALQHCLQLPPDAPFWSDLHEIAQAHHALLARIEHDYHAFSPLDERFHSLLNQVVQNRFVKQLQKSISLIFHYHYQWDKKEERQRNEAAIYEHLTLISALQNRDTPRVMEAAQRHLRSSQTTLLSSLRDHQRS